MIVPVEELQVGMFVEVPLSWHEHPFLKNSFLITSEEEIYKFKSLGIDCVVVDPARSRPRKIAAASPAEGSERDNDEEGVVVVPAELITSIKDQALPAEKKAQLVITHSITMMQKMLEKPTAQRIAAAKKGIAEIVNLILTDDNTTYYLLNITTHDFYTYTHSVNVGVLGVALAKAIFRNSSDHDLQALGAGFFLHDLGKVKIAADIINKPAALTEEEMRQMRRHPAEGYKILVETRQLTEEARVIVLQHHERADGTGYPRGLRKNEIHIYARLCTLADVFDALTSERPYRKKMAAFDALTLMRAEMMSHFQAELFEKFVLMFRKPIHGC